MADLRKFLVFSNVRHELNMECTEKGCSWYCDDRMETLDQLVTAARKHRACPYDEGDPRD